MGVAESRQLASSLNEACHHHEDSESLDLTSIQRLIDSPVKALWESASDAARVSIRGAVTASSGQPRLGQGSKSQKPITLSIAVESQLHGWASHPKTALCPAKICGDPSEDYAVSLVQSLIDLESTNEVTAVKRRLALVSIMRLKNALGGDYPAIAEYISTIQKHTVDKKTVTEWCNVGARYDAIARDLGGLEVLFVLPRDIPTTG